MSSAELDARTLLSRAMDRHRDGRLAEAEQDYLAVAAAGYRRDEVVRLLAGLAEMDGRVELAIARWDEILEKLSGDVGALVARGRLNYRLGRWAEAASAFEAAAARAPDHPEVVAFMGIALFDAEREAGAAGRKRPAVPPLVELSVRRAVSAAVPFWHIPMMNDRARNDAFERAVVRAIAAHGANARVLDIGTGSGLLAMMAARAGAAHVDSCEIVPVIARTARRTVELNGHGHRVKVIPKRSVDLVMGTDVEGAADILISEVLSSDVLTEGVLATFEDALDRLVKPSGTVIPRAVTAIGCLAGGETLEHLTRVGQVSGFDLSPFAALSCPRLPIWQDSPPWLRLSSDFDLLQLDLTQRSHPPCETRIGVPVSAHGVACGVIQWMRIDLDEVTTFSTAPEGAHRQGNWLQILHTFARPVPVSAGQTVDLIVGHDRANLLVALA